MDKTVMLQAYELAYKKGKQQWHHANAQGKSGYLTFLDGQFEKADILSEINLGLVEVPLHKIVGTYTQARSVSFAENFMPIMPPHSEFARKWMALYQTHLEEGIRDPIKVYEYLNQFFVVEGNKRTSVLKAVEAVSINAYVTRIIPKRDFDNLTHTLYYEFMDFYKATQINTIWFSKEGRFSELLMYIEKYHPTISVGDTVAKDFLAHIYNPFREIYLKEGGGQLPITTGDALLDFLKIYGLPHEIVPFEHTDTIKKLIAELEVMTTDEANVQQQPLPTLSLKKRSVFQSMTHLMSAKKVLKIAFVYAKTPESSGWANCHELGRQHIENIFQNTIQTTAICDVPENEQAYPILENLAKEGYDIIFTTSPTFVAPSLKAAMQFPRTKFFSCAATKSYKSLTLYFGRIHEPKYLLGMIAGSLTQTNQIGYVAPYPISEVISSINAFTLGAQAVNPYVKVKAKWSYRWDNSKEIRNVENVLLEEGVDIIANDDLPVPGRTSKQYGVYAIDRQTGEKTHYAMAIWDWGAFYEKVIGNYLKGTWERIENPSEKEDNPMNFWLGMDTGIVDILYSNRHLSWPTKYLLDQMRQAIIRQNFKIFKGPIYANDRLLKVKENETCGYEEIINMDWFVECVETIVPEIDHLTPSDPFLFMQTIIDKKE